MRPVNITMILYQESRYILSKNQWGFNCEKWWTLVLKSGKNTQMKCDQQNKYYPVYYPLAFSSLKCNCQKHCRVITKKSQKNIKVNKNQAHFYVFNIKWFSNCSGRPVQISEYYLFNPFLPVLDGLSCNPLVSFLPFYWFKTTLHHTVGLECAALTLFICPAVVCIFAIPSECDHGQWRRWQVCDWMRSDRFIYSTPAPAQARPLVATGIARGKATCSQ